MAQDTQIVLPFARLAGKNLQADFDGGTLSSDGGVLFLREIEAQVGVIRRFAEALHDPRDARYTDHSYEELLSQGIFQIACGYADANDCPPCVTIPPSRPRVAACRSQTIRWRASRA